jgi:hypothetical protein
MPAPVFEKLLDDLRDLDFRGHIVMAPWCEAMLDDRLAGWLQMTKARLPRCMIEILTNGLRRVKPGPFCLFLGAAEAF